MLNVKEISSIDFNASLSSIENKEEGMGSSINYRLVQYYRSIGYILSAPLKFFTGWGIGSYGILENGVDERNYPHNCILEILIESGLVGFILFATTLFCFLHYSIKTKLLGKYFFFILFLFYYLGFFLTSSSIAEARIPFALLGLLLLLGERAQNEALLFTNENRKSPR